MKNKGFTLVELLAVIVILAVLIVLGIPVSNRVINNIRKSAVSKYADKIYTSALNTFEYDLSNDQTLSYKCALYDIKDIGIDDVGNYNGYVIVKPSLDKRNVYMTYRDNKFYLLHYDYSEQNVLDKIGKYVANEYSDNASQREAYLIELGCASKAGSKIIFNGKVSSSIKISEFNIAEDE